FEGHYDEAAHLSQWTLDSCGDAGCHSTRDLMGAHVEKNAQFDCFGCHGSTDPVVVAAIDTGATACGSCHPGVSESTGHRTAHWANPMLIGATGPNYSYWTGTMGGAPSTDCAGCHTSNLIDEHMGYVDPDTGFALIQPRYDSSGASLDCGTCHGASASVEVQLAITMGDTRCDACHSVHGPIGVIHQTSYKVDPEVDCSGCHSRDLTVVHNGVMTATTPSGRVLSGCSICHSYWEGETGALVEAAIAANNTDCTACHPTYHGDSSSHVAVSSESLDCGRCHGPVVEGELRVEPVHAEATLGACAVCHANAARVPDISAKTAECASCHAIAGTEYHRAADDKHTFGSMDPGCVAAGCHASNMLPAAHEPYLARYPQYTDTCALCHLNEDVSRIDWSTASADCSTCHEVHGDIEQIHQAPGSTECTACHTEGPDVRLLHGASPEASCAVCHNSTVDTSGTAACVNCHDYSPVAQKHYDASDHTAVEVPGCSNCHYLELKPEHDKPTSGPVGCVSCHTSPWFPDTWNKSCMGCHEVRH
ncbi:MAG: cytochrome c3 family protein, partial [Actinomycetota bacterium]|nr:cytochrome c3 family protein [Actinomycetota bacterium]